MKNDSFFEYLIPFVLLLIYFFANRGKKKEEPTPIAEKWEGVSTPVPLPPPPQVVEKRAPLAESSSYLTTIAGQHAESLVSAELAERFDMDIAYAHKLKNLPCRGKRLLRQLPSTKDAFVLQEIFRRPDF